MRLLPIPSNEPFKQFVGGRRIGNMIQLLPPVDVGVIGQVQIDQRRLQIAMAKEALDPTQQSACFKQMSGHAVAE